MATFADVENVLVYDDGKISTKPITEDESDPLCKAVNLDGQIVTFGKEFSVMFSESIDDETGAIIAADEAVLVWVLNRKYNEALATAKTIRQALKTLAGVS